MQVNETGRNRVVIEGVFPLIDGGRFPIKRISGEPIVVEADAFADGHDIVACVLLHRHMGTHDWREVRMDPLGNDRWRGAFTPIEIGRYQYTLRAWVDRFGSWSRDLAKRVVAGQNVTVDLLIGAELVDAAARRAGAAEAAQLRSSASALRAGADGAIDAALSEELAALMWRYTERAFATSYDMILEVCVDRERARFSAWYELFPRACATEPGRHGTFKDVEARLPYVASMGFDVLYLPPIHPIGRSYRKGKNNTPEAGSDDPGSPWAIGGPEGGHTAIHPQLGTLTDFRRLVARAREHDLEIAMDLAFQCSPDHPYISEHPEWFLKRPDGSIQYAENPPKKYQDIYPFYFESQQWRALWEELHRVVFFWIEQGVRIFRVDNPHTKPFPFWEWLIGEVKSAHPETIFLSEAFTRPKVMDRLAKLGFTQSYTYFTWRTTKHELIEYLTELTQTEAREFFRPNFWPNTPDILPEHLQVGGRAAFLARLVLAATLAASYGIYGPAFELCHNRPLAAGKEEYLNSEKFEIACCDLDWPDSLKDVIAHINCIRRENLALHSNTGLRFHMVDNDQLIAYTKSTPNRDNIVLTIVNLDPHHIQSGRVELPLAELGIDAGQSYQAHDLISDARYLWNGPRNYVELDPRVMPAAIFRLRRKLRTERDFDYYM